MNWLLPPGASTFASDIDRMYYLILVITGVAFVVVEAGLLWFMWKYRAGSGRPVHYTHGNNKAEVIWTAIPAVTVVIIGLLSAPIIEGCLRGVRTDDELDAREGTHLVLDVVRRVLVGDRDERREELAHLTDEQILVRPAGRQTDDLEPIRVPPDDVERLRADRAGRSEDGQRPHGDKGTPSLRGTRPAGVTRR